MEATISKKPGAYSGDGRKLYFAIVNAQVDNESFAVQLSSLTCKSNLLIFFHFRINIESNFCDLIC